MTGLAPLEAVSHRFNLIFLILNIAVLTSAVYKIVKKRKRAGLTKVKAMTNHSLENVANYILNRNLKDSTNFIIAGSDGGNRNRFLTKTL